MVLAGDDEQAINGFRGADHNAFAHFGELEGAEAVELTVTWRSSTGLVEAYLNPFRERWFSGREPLVAGHDSPVRGAFSTEEIHDGEGAVFAQMAAEVASLGSLPKRRGTMGSLPRSELRDVSLVRAPLVGVLCALNKDVDEAKAALMEYGIAPTVLKRSPRHPRTHPLLEVLLAALDPHDTTSFLGGHQDPSWAPRHLLSALAKAPGRDLAGNEFKLVTKILALAADAAPRGRDAVRAVLESHLGPLASGDPSSGPQRGLPAWAADSLRLVNLVLADRMPGTRPVVDLVDATFDLSSHSAWALERPLGRTLAAASDESDQLVAAQLLRNVDVMRRRDTAQPVGPTVVLGTVNQVKGLTFDLVWILVPARNRFPHGDAAAWEECCRWWVAVTRARHLVRVLVGNGVSVPYLP